MGPIWYTRGQQLHPPEADLNALILWTGSPIINGNESRIYAIERKSSASGFLIPREFLNFIVLNCFLGFLTLKSFSPALCPASTGEFSWFLAL